jgi:hypothetical protein
LQSTVRGMQSDDGVEKMVGIYFCFAFNRSVHVTVT